MAKQQESVVRQIGESAARQNRGFPREFKLQLTGYGDEAGHQQTGGWGDALARQISVGRADDADAGSMSCSTLARATC